ncbi:MAG: YwaF family protein [Clostridia bacterium]|nr:YwaF family protein [Clostridia bacterium]
MYKLLNELLSDKKGGEVFSCFGICHIIYMLIIFGGIAFFILLLKNKSDSVKSRAVELSISIAFGLYIADFFLMPFAYGKIDLEKLPFHACTASCVCCFLSRKNTFLSRFKNELAILGLLSNIIYVIYPAGIGWYMIHPLSYRALQTLLFHGVMTAYGIFVLAFERSELRWKNSYKDLLVIVAMTVWALIGNTLYCGTAGDYSHNFNWFFVTQDPFYILPQPIAPYVMPFVMIIVFYLADLLLYSIYFGVKKYRKKIDK